jgi:hypothetical protein
MRRAIGATIIGASAGALASCAGIEFSDTQQRNAFTYYEPVPALSVTTAADCAISATVISVPGPKRSIRFRPGLGTAKLGFTVSNGMLTAVNSETSGAVGDALNIADKLKAAAALSLVTRSTACTPKVVAYQIKYTDGKLTIDPNAIYEKSAEALPATKSTEPDDDAQKGLDTIINNSM